jgi:hypothetical protein
MDTQSVSFLLRDYDCGFTFLGGEYDCVDEVIARFGAAAIEAATYAKFLSDDDLLQDLLAIEEPLEGLDSGVLNRIRDEFQAMRKEKSPPTLEEAILNNPDPQLAKACQDLFEATDLLMSLVQVTDFDAGFVSRKLQQSGVNFTQEQAAEAIQKLQGTLGTVTYIKDLLRETE